MRHHSVTLVALLIAAGSTVHAQSDEPSAPVATLEVPLDTVALALEVDPEMPLCDPWEEAEEPLLKGEGEVAAAPSGPCLFIDLRVCTGTMDELGNCLSGCCPPPKPVALPKALPMPPAPPMPPGSMGLVGLHIVSKTKTTPDFVWATFEHRDHVQP